MSRRHLLPSALLLAGCAGPRSPAPAPAVVYAATKSAPVYAVSDTVHYVIQAGDRMGVDTRSGYTATMRLAFAPDSGDFRVTATLLRFAGTFSSAMARTVTADEKGVGGPFVLRVSPLGNVDMVDAPSLSEAFQQVTGAKALVRNFFVHLPGRPVHVGDTWTDTINNRDPGDMTTDSRSILKATAAGDTVVQGRALLLVRTRYENTVHVSGTSGGTEIAQHLRGITTGTFLWDVARHLLTERTERGEMDGTLDLPGRGVTGLPVHATVYRHAQLLSRTPD
jgi:hypothetical protein